MRRGGRCAVRAVQGLDAEKRPAWALDEGVVFGRYDLFAKRCRKLISLFTTVQQFSLLAQVPRPPAVPLPHRPAAHGITRLPSHEATAPGRDARRSRRTSRAWRR